jgi:L-alanine-DL-glutamate epimerase-like enolase superfamily enzyme
MDKRLLKRHKRQVLRAKERVRLSEPDVRTPEQIKAAREASRAAIELRTDPHAAYASTPARNHPASPAHPVPEADI